MAVREEGTQAPSIGSVDLQFDQKGNRVRQIVEKRILTEGQILPILTNASLVADSNGATRSSVRALVHQGLLQEWGDSVINGYDIEASVPLSGEHADFALVYLGSKKMRRYSTDAVMEAEAAIVDSLHAKEPKDPRAVIEKARAAGFTLERLTYPLSENDMQRLVQMYQESFTSYPFNIEEEIADMVQRESSYVYAARRNDGLLYAVCATEEVQLSLADGTNFSMREMGDSARIQSPEGQGLNAPLKLMLLLEAYRDGTDLLFCETRAALGAVNANNYNIGMQYSGLLPKSTVISGPQDVLETELDGEVNRLYGNMNVWSMNRDQIADIARQLGERR